MKQKDRVLSSHSDCHHYAGEGSGRDELENRSCHVLAAEVAIRTGHDDDAERGSVNDVEGEKQNAPALDEAGATAGANTQANEGDGGVPGLVTVTSTANVTAFAVARTTLHDDVAGKPSYTSHALPSLDETAQAAAASSPFSSLHPLRVLFSSDPPPSSSIDPVPACLLPNADAALAPLPVPPPVSFPVPRAR